MRFSLSSCPQLDGHEGYVEIQLALDGQNFIRPDYQGRNRVRPKIHYYMFAQRVYSRTPAGGPLRGGTRLTIRGEGLEGYGRTLDYINQMVRACMPTYCCSLSLLLAAARLYYYCAAPLAALHTCAC